MKDASSAPHSAVGSVLNWVDLLAAVKALLAHCSETMWDGCLAATTANQTITIRVSVRVIVRITARDAVTTIDKMREHVFARCFRKLVEKLSLRKLAKLAGSNCLFGYELVTFCACTIFL